jgi:hypothetical protein
MMNMSEPQKVVKVGRIAEDTRNASQKLYDAKYAPKRRVPPTLLLLPMHNVASTNRPKKHFAPLIKRNAKNPEIFDALERAGAAKLEALKNFNYFAQK